MPLNREEWIAVVAISLPIIVIDEILKLMSRLYLRLAARPENLKLKKL